MDMPATKGAAACARAAPDSPRLVDLLVSLKSIQLLDIEDIVNYLFLDNY